MAVTTQKKDGLNLTIMKADPLQRLLATWVACTRCGLYKRRVNVVMGRGSIPTPLVMIGEAPGKNEDETGLAFVGKAGQEILDRDATELGLDLSRVYITNIIACRPPKNRSPIYDEIRACRPRLEALVGLARPKVILILGSSALTALTGVQGIGRTRGKWTETKWPWRAGVLTIPTLSTFHPAALLAGRRSDEVRAAKEHDQFKEDLKDAWKKAFGGS